MSTFVQLDHRSREIFRLIVDAYVESGEPIGSRTLSRKLGMSLSPATIRNVMADLEEMGLLFSPHTSAGRLPTELGLRFFVNGLLERERLSEGERETIDNQCLAAGKSVQEALDAASSLLSGLSRCAGLVVAPKTEAPLRHIEFIFLGPGRGLVVMVTEDGIVENRVVDLPPEVTASALVEATNFLGAKIVGRTLEDASTLIAAELEKHRAELDALTSRVVEAGLATWAGESGEPSLIVHGRSHLLEDVTALADLDRIRALFTALEQKDSMLKLLDAAGGGEGVQIYIGSDSNLFSVSGCSTVIAPYMNNNGRVVGALGVIGPTRINYARIIPMVDYTAKVVSRLIG